MFEQTKKTMKCFIIGLRQCYRTDIELNIVKSYERCALLQEGVKPFLLYSHEIRFREKRNTKSVAAQ